MSRAGLLPTACVLAAALAFPARAHAHELRPAFLSLVETAPGTFAVTWKVPRVGGTPLGLTPLLPPGSRTVGARRRVQTPDAVLEAWAVHRDGGLAGQRLRIAGLGGGEAEVLVRVSFLDGRLLTERVLPAQPFLVVPERQAIGRVAWTYLHLGVEHILLGVDHLAFVLGLLLLTGAGWRLVKTVTAFTAAHSLTLAAAALGVVRVPQAPVEAVIALSIVFVAREIALARRAAPGLTARRPWVVAFSFGLLHGLGFAGALAEVGLPHGDLPLALLTFNVGVELGQLAFVGAVLLASRALAPLARRAPGWVAALPAYGIGTLAAFWCVGRVAALF